MKRINKNFFAALALTVTLISCSQDPSNSSVSDVISRGQSIIFYKTTFQNKPAIARRFCAAKDVIPTRTCDQNYIDSGTNEHLRPTTLLLLEDFQSHLASKFGSEDPKYFRENGTEILSVEIAELEEFLKSPTLSEEEINQAKKELSKLLQLRGLKLRVDSIMKALSEEKVVSYPSFSEDFKLLNNVFTAENLKLHIFDAATNLWWVYLGKRDFFDAIGEPCPVTGRRSPNITSCAEQFNNSGRLPTYNEAQSTGRGFVFKQLQESFGSAIFNSWTVEPFAIGWAVRGDNSGSYRRNSTTVLEQHPTACVISGS